MLDQSFSAKNFRRILDLENRKGVHVEDKLSMTTIRRINEEIRDCNIQIKIKKKTRDVNAIKTLYEKKKDLRQKKETELETELERISQNIAAKKFKIIIKKVNIPGGKPIYTTPNQPEHFFALKQVQKNISRLFRVKQSNRYAIIEQVISLLGDQFPKFVIRTDIKDFYENIQHEPLLQRINQDNLLTPLSRKILTSILKSYKDQSGSNKGIPRGIGVSAYLAELFMRDIDSDLQELKGVTYYARYVDDIIIIFTPSSVEQNRNYLEDVKNIVEGNYKLRVNSTKTQSFDLRNLGPNHSFNYLGYNITFGTGPVKINLTASKVQKYRDRVKLAFDDYVNYSKVSEKEARRTLVKRIRFLTGNTRLTNNKKNILTGIYYSNSHLTDLNQLNEIDAYLSRQINDRISSQHLKDRLKKYGFKIGYEQRRFSPFTTDEMSEIMRIWRKAY